MSDNNEKDLPFVDELLKEAGKKFPLSVPDEDYNDSPEMQEILGDDEEDESN